MKSIDNNENKKNWYVINTFSGYESNVKLNLEKRILAMNLQDKIFDVFIPTEKVIEVNKGKKKEKELKKFPGYLLINMIMDDNTWFVIRNTPGIIGFIGSNGRLSKPTPLTDIEANKMLNNRNIIDEIKVILDYEIGDTVMIINGKFTGNTGKVVNIDINNNKVEVEIVMLGKQILELKISDVELLQ